MTQLMVLVVRSGHVDLMRHGVRIVTDEEGVEFDEIEQA